MFILSCQSGPKLITKSYPAKLNPGFKTLKQEIIPRAGRKTIGNIAVNFKPNLMKMTCLTGLSLLFIYDSAAQLNEHFTDGDMTANPSWSGTAASWSVNPGLQLQSANTTANSTFYLCTPVTLPMQTEWTFYTRLDFNPSSVNYTDVFLTASAADLTAAGTTGYFVRIGNTDDEVSLYRKDPSGTVKLIDGVNGILNNSSNSLLTRVTRTTTGQWQLLRDLSATGNNYFPEGTVQDVTYTGSAFFGILVRQSTTGFTQKHFFDDIVIQPYLPDTSPPAVVTADAVSGNMVDLLFNEAVDPASVQTIANYFTDHGIGIPQSATRDNSNPALVHLLFAAVLPAGVTCTMNINGIKDIAGNVLNNGTATFSYYQPRRYDVVIDELMADPSPAVTLPEQEWLELRNTATSAINLQGWKICDASGCSAGLPALWLKPDSLLVLCSTAALPSLQGLGRVAPVAGFPSLDNTGESIWLTDAAGQLIHSVTYSDAWYRNELKKQGGWSLEMIDPHNPCTGAGNWMASTSLAGATPGIRNAADSINKDDTGPVLWKAYADDSLHMTLFFDGPLDSLSASQTNHYTISNGIGQPQSCQVLFPAFKQVSVLLAQPLLPGKVYEATVSGITDCTGNPVENENRVRVALASVADSMDVVINEVLFNPYPGGVDYVELYNRGKKIVDLASLYLANRNSAGQVSNIAQVSAERQLLFPGDYVLLCSDPVLVNKYYISTNPKSFVKVSGMPSYNDDEGDVVLLNRQGQVIDELVYDENWHFALLSDPEGVALERIDPGAPTQNRENWHSAATHTGYGTPGYKNSQYRINEEVQGTIEVQPTVISPDNDGVDDFATISYRFPSPGYVATITVFDASGLPVHFLQRNALCGSSGYFRWDGLNEKGQRLLPGLYILLTEVFNLDGKKKKMKNVIAVGSK